MCCEWEQRLMICESSERMTADDSSMATIWDFILKLIIFLVWFKEAIVIFYFFNLQLDNFVFIQIAVITHYNSITESKII